MNWHNVNKSEPCPICHKTDWCNLSNDGAVCICHRVESPYLAKSGSGWIHALRANDDRRATSEERKWKATHRPQPINHQQTIPLDFARVHASYDADPILIEGLATTLGVDDAALKAMDVRFNHFDECWSFPMRDAEGHIIGLRFRELAGSRKWSARGSHDGLFGGRGNREEGRGNREEGRGNREEGTGNREMIVAEGASDTAALLSLFHQTTKHHIVGRSSCQTGAALLRQLIRRIRPRTVTIVADNDAPGIRGANLLAQQLKGDTSAIPHGSFQLPPSPPVRVLIVPHPYKDIRAWYLSNRLTPKLFSDMVSVQTDFAR